MIKPKYKYSELTIGKMQNTMTGICQSCLSKKSYTSQFQTMIAELNEVAKRSITKNQYVVILIAK